MNPIDPLEEERRLKEQYSCMYEDELEALANQAYDLTEIARRVLQFEISRRRLDIALRDSPLSRPANALAESEDPSDSPFVTIHTSTDVAEARRLQQALDAAYIAYCWGKDDLENIDLFNSELGDGVALKVWQADRERAWKAIASVLPKEPDGPDYAAVCPKCSSAEIVFQGCDPYPAVAKSKFTWSCDSCGYEWQDEGVEERAQAQE